MINKVVKKIFNNDDKFTIFYSEWCPWSMKAVDLLKEKKVEFKGYKIENVGEDMKSLSEQFLKEPSLDYNPKHLTRPVIFKNKKFIGGYTDLVQYFTLDK